MRRRNVERYIRQPASMTVFFCLILLMISALVCTCLESARTAGLRFMAKTASDSALQSVFADYHGQLWEDYHVFFHYDKDGDMTDSLKGYLKYYTNPQEGLYGSQEYTDLWNLSVESVSVVEAQTAVSDGGRLFLEQAVEFEKYQIAETLLESLLERIDILDEINKIRSFAVRISECFEQIQEISTLYQDVRDGIKTVMAAISEVRDILTSGNRDLETVRAELKSLAEKITWLKQLAQNYLKSSEKIGNLADELTKEYGDSEENVYGQQIRQLKEFALQGLFGSTVSGVVSKADGMLSQIYQLIQEIEEFKEELGDGDSIKSLYEKAVALTETGGLLMEELESLFDQADSSGEGESGGEENEDGSGADNSDETEDADDGQSLLEIVKQWKNMAVLSLVMGEGAVQTRSDYFSDSSSLPSATVNSSLKDVTLAEKGLFIFYITDAFTNVLSDKQGEFAYQQEYILFGKKDSRSNLTSMAESLLAVREGLNLAFLLTNTRMRTAAESAAYALVGATGMYPLVLLTQFIILAAWAFAESVADVQTLFKGESVPLWKTETTWKTSISGLVSSGSSGSVPGTSFEIELSYKDYLMLFLLVKDTQTLCLRSMDIIQEEIGSSNSGFLMADCYGAAEISVHFSSPYRLITLPLVGEAAGAGHQIQTYSSYRYQ